VISVVQNNCDHEWKSSGLWDGKGSDGQKTGGVVYKCVKCDAEARSLTEIEELGGVVLQGFNVFGDPTNSLGD
jgi:hypothetical protein